MIKKGFKHSKKTIEKMKKFHKENPISFWKGKKMSITHKKNISDSHKGEKNPFFDKKHTIDSKNKMSNSHNGMSKPWVKSPTKGKKLSILHRKHISEEHIKNREKHPMWKGGIYIGNLKIRDSFEYKLWREEVFKKNNFTCQKYNIKGGELVAHHILNFSDYPELRFDINNGITLSKQAHKEFHKIYGVKNNTHEQLLEFLNK